MEQYKEAYLHQCDNCGFVFSARIPTEQELNAYYNESYEITRYFSPITIKRYHQLLDQFEPYRKTGKLLDIGAGYGFFLEIAKERGWEVYGTEVMPEAVEQCKSKGINIFTGRIQEIDFGDLEFDVILSIEVIEHLNNPVEVVETARKLLRKGGAFYLTTPNFNSYLRYRLKDQYDVIGYPNHLCYYTKPTLAKLFNEHGFKTKKIKTTGFSLTRLRTSKGISDQDYVSETSDDEMMRYRIEKSTFLKFVKWISNGVLNTLKIGDSLKGFFIKE